MQIYNVPYNFNHEGKVFGGYVSIRQAIYLIFGASMLVIFFIPIVNIIIKTLMFLVLVTMFVLVAFLLAVTNHLKRNIRLYFGL